MSSGQARAPRAARTRRLAAAVAAGLTCAAAAAIPDAGAAPAAGTGVTYTRKTVEVSAYTIRHQLLSVSKNGATYTFKSKVGALKHLAAGRVMLLDKLTVRDVTKTSTSHGHLVVDTDPAPITDVIANGTLDLTRTIDFRNGFGVGGVAVPQGRTGVPAGSATSKLGLVPMRAGGITFKGKTHSYNYTINFTPGTNSLAVKITISKASPVEVEATITGTLNNLKTAGSISVDHGALNSAKLVASHLSGQFKLAYSAKPISAFGLGQAGGIKITLPGEIAVPFFIGPVPFYLGVKVAFFASAGFSSFDQELSGDWTLDYDGAGGFHTSSSGATSAAGALKGIGDILLKAANAVRKGPLSFILGAQMPQLELGLGVKGLNVAGNVTLIGQTEIATQGANCDTRKMEILGTAGADASFFGFSADLGYAKLFDKTLHASYPRGCGVAP